MGWGLVVSDRWSDILFSYRLVLVFVFGGWIESANNLAGFQWVD